MRVGSWGSPAYGPGSFKEPGSDGEDASCANPNKVPYEGFRVGVSTGLPQGNLSPEGFRSRCTIQVRDNECIEEKLNCMSCTIVPTDGTGNDDFPV